MFFFCKRILKTELNSSFRHEFCPFSRNLFPHLGFNLHVWCTGWKKGLRSFAFQILIAFWIFFDRFACDRHLEIEISFGLFDQKCRFTSFILPILLSKSREICTGWRKSPCSITRYFLHAVRHFKVFVFDRNSKTVIFLADLTKISIL